MKKLAQILLIIFLLTVSGFIDVLLGIHYDSILDYLLCFIGVVCFCGAYDLFKNVRNKI